MNLDNRLYYFFRRTICLSCTQ